MTPNEDQAVTIDLFDSVDDGRTRTEAIAPGAVLLHSFARSVEKALLDDLHWVAGAAPFRHMVTPGGHRMSAAMTNCGTAGWVSDRGGYRYDPNDPASGRAWPPMPRSFLDLAASAAAAAGFAGFLPDACLINRYEPGARLTLHQDRDEDDFSAPIVSVSLGLPATFLFGGLRRNDPVRRVPLRHGDIAVWGGPARLAFHGVAPMKRGEHPLLGAHRINLTFRKARG